MRGGDWKFKACDWSRVWGITTHAIRARLVIAFLKQKSMHHKYTMKSFMIEVFPISLKLKGCCVKLEALFIENSLEWPMKKCRWRSLLSFFVTSGPIELKLSDQRLSWLSLQGTVRPLFPKDRAKWPAFGQFCCFYVCTVNLVIANSLGHKNKVSYIRGLLYQYSKHEFVINKLDQYHVF